MCAISWVQWQFTIPTEPAAPPTSVEAFFTSLSSIHIMWNEVAPIDQNGIITQYEVQYTQRSNNDNSTTNITVDSTVLSLDLSGLEPYAEFFIHVRAYTATGAGPYSDTLVLAEERSGKIIMSIRVHNLVSYIVYSCAQLQQGHH